MNETQWLVKVELCFLIVVPVMTLSYRRPRGDGPEPLPSWYQRFGHYLLLHAGGHHHARHYPGVCAGCKCDRHTYTLEYTDLNQCKQLCIVVLLCRKSTGRNTSPKPSTANSTSRASSAPSTYSPSAGAQASCSLYVQLLSWHCSFFYLFHKLKKCPWL